MQNTLLHGRQAAITPGRGWSSYTRALRVKVRRWWRGCEAAAADDQYTVHDTDQSLTIGDLGIHWLPHGQCGARRRQILFATTP